MVIVSGLVLLAGAGCTLVSGVFFYLSSRHQQIFARRLSNRLCLWAAMGMVTLAICALTAVRGMAATCFMVVLLLMVVCSFLPLAIATVQSGKKRS